MSLEKLLTPSEARVFELIGKALSAKEIGRRLDMTPETVRNYTNRLMRKIGARNRTHAALLANGVNIV